MDKSMSKGEWNQFIGTDKKQWDEITDDDLDLIEGDTHKFAIKLQGKYGKDSEEADKEVRKLRERRSKFAGAVKAVGIITGDEYLELKRKTHSSKAEFKNYLSLEDEIADIREKNIVRTNVRTDRYKKKINLAYWTDVNNIDNNQIILQARESLPEIHTLKKMYINIVMGRIVMQIDDQVEKICSPGDVIDVPSRTRIKIKNRSSYKSAILVLKSQG